MSVPHECPSPLRLQALLSSDLSQHDQLSIQAHLDQCEKCQRVLESLVDGQESWFGGVHHLTQATVVQETALERAMQQAKQLNGEPTSADSFSSEPVVLDFLKPTDQAGILGRLEHYDVIKVVGRGGMGIVLKALDTSLRRIVAIKVMSPHLAANATARRRFVREAQAAAAVAHDHVVAIHSVQDKHEPPYLVMQFIEGKTLHERIDLSGPLGVHEILRIGMQSSAALAAAHAQGLVHRDIKPANILLENGVERVKITDFGLARAVDDASTTQSGVIAGTPQFMSPEQARGDSVDPRSDLFSLGSVLYAMCVGHAPFRASTTMGVLLRVCESSPRPIRELNADVPEWLSDIITKMLAKDPADRFQTAKELTELMGRHLAAIQDPLGTPRVTAIDNPAPVVDAPRKHSAGKSEAAFSDGVSSDGPYLVVERDARLPDRCVKTNEPAAYYYTKRVSERGQGTTFPWLNRGSQIQIGLNSSWMMRRWVTLGVGWACLLAGIALTVAGYSQLNAGLALVGIIVGQVAGLVLKLAQVVSVEKVDGDHIFLRGVCSEYRAMVAASTKHKFAERSGKGNEGEALNPAWPRLGNSAILGLSISMVTVLLVTAGLARFGIISLPLNAAYSSFHAPILLLLVVSLLVLIATAVFQAIRNQDGLGMTGWPQLGTLAILVGLLMLVETISPAQYATGASAGTLRSTEFGSASSGNVLVPRNPALIKELRELVQQCEAEAKLARQRAAHGTISTLEALSAEQPLIEAKIRLATAESRPADLMALQDELVTNHESMLAMAERLFNAGIMSPAELSRIRTDLIRARVQRESVK
jgi:serine/threonine protein kinase